MANSTDGRVRLITAREELQALFDTRLGVKYDPHVFDTVDNLQYALWRIKQDLLKKFETSELTQDEFATALHAALEDCASKCEQALGIKDFVQLFGFLPKDAATLEPLLISASSAVVARLARRSVVLCTKLLQEALAFHLDNSVRHIEGTLFHFRADFSSHRLELMADLMGEPKWLNQTEGEESVVFSKDGIILELN